MVVTGFLSSVPVVPARGVRASAAWYREGYDPREGRA
jgi:hypothetical protein